MATLYKHVNNTDVAVEVLSFRRIPKKPYAIIKVVWWNIGPHKPFCLNIVQHLTDATINGNKKDKIKYPLIKWATDWRLYDSQ